MEPFQILCSVAAVILAFYYFFISNLDFWKSRGVRGPRPIPGLGNFKDILFQKLTFGDYVKKLYNEYRDEPMFGIFSMKEPILIVKDLDLIKDILIKDFSTFGNRPVFTVHEKAEPLTQNLFNLELKKWRPLRAKLSPVFTTRKLKDMFLLITECADHLVDYTEKLASKNEPTEVLDLMAKYTIDVVGSCAFGIEMNALSNEESEFRRIGREIFKLPLTGALRMKLKRFSPWLYDILGPILPDTDMQPFFINLVVNTINYREKNNIVRNDFIDTLRELKKQANQMDDLDFTDIFMVSQAYMFFAAGFETSSTAMTGTLYELALNQKVQDKLRKEIDEVYIKYGSNLTYVEIKKMDYLDKVFKETIRKYPALMFIMRKTLSSYTFKGTKISIPKDQRVYIPLYALQRDPLIYSEPEVFNPERFNEEAIRSRHPMSFLSFGNGPRNCIGSRFGIYQSKLGLVKLLRNYKFEPCEKTEIPFVRDEKFIVAPKNGIYLQVTKIN